MFSFSSFGSVLVLTEGAEERHAWSGQRALSCRARATALCTAGRQDLTRKEVSGSVGARRVWTPGMGWWSAWVEAWGMLAVGLCLVLQEGRSWGGTTERPLSHVLTDKRRIHLRFASVRTYTFFTTGFPRFLSIRGATGLQAFDLPLLTNYPNPIYN
jgi:hypothetical protein